MDDLESFLEETWSGILSRQPEEIRRAYLALDENNRQEVYKHLSRMTSEGTWHPEQEKSARKALRVIEELD